VGIAALGCPPGEARLLVFAMIVRCKSIFPLN